MTVNQAAKRLGVSRRTIYYLMKRGQLPWRQRSQGRVLDRAAVERVWHERWLRWRQVQRPTRPWRGQL
jgi:excisionase family DNA binding protein